MGEGLVGRLWASLLMDSDDELQPQAQSSAPTAPRAAVTIMTESVPSLPPVPLDNGAEAAPVAASASRPLPNSPDESASSRQGGLAASSSGIQGQAGQAVIVIDSDDDDDTGQESASYSRSPLRFWIARIGHRMEQTVAQVEELRLAGQVRWNLPPTLEQNIVDWTVHHNRDVLGEEYVRAFYIGITHKVHWRWTDPVSGHKKKLWQCMYICAVSDDCKQIAKAEIDVIKQFRFLGPRGVFLGYREEDGQQVGHPLCANRNPGSEGGFHGIPPHCLYVVWRWNRRGQ